MIVSFRPYFSANGKVQSAPKKHPACECQLPVLHVFSPALKAHLERRDDVALDGVSDGRLDLIQREVTPEGVQCHCTADDSRVVAHGKGGHRGH
jgi:hypothetical protein